MNSSTPAAITPNMPLNENDKRMIYDAMQEVMDTYKVSGVSGVSSEIENCYKYVNEAVPTKGLLYCIAMDADASEVFPAIEVSHNFPPTPEFIQATYQARIRKNLEAAVSFSDPNQQSNIIKTVEDELNSDDIVKYKKETNPAKNTKDQYQFNR